MIETLDMDSDKERERILAANQRRSSTTPQDRYAPWNAAAQLAASSRVRTAAQLLKKESVFPVPGQRVLEVGCGTRGWLPTLLEWGLRCEDLSGIDIDPDRAAAARHAFPGADLHAGDARALPWEAGCFQLVIASTMFSSVLDANNRAAMADEIVRVLAPGGALLWYDLAYDNPANPDVRGIDRRELRHLFDSLSGPVVRVTLVPPIARPVVRVSWVLASMLESITLLRSHLMAVLLTASRAGGARDYSSLKRCR